MTEQLGFAAPTLPSPAGTSGPAPTPAAVPPPPPAASAPAFDTAFDRPPDAPESSVDTLPHPPAEPAVAESPADAETLPAPAATVPLVPPAQPMAMPDVSLRPAADPTADEFVSIDWNELDPGRSDPAAPLVGPMLDELPVPTPRDDEAIAIDDVVAIDEVETMVAPLAPPSPSGPVNFALPTMRQPAKSSPELESVEIEPALAELIEIEPLGLTIEFDAVPAAEPVAEPVDREPVAEPVDVDSADAFAEPEGSPDTDPGTEPTTEEIAGAPASFDAPVDAPSNAGLAAPLRVPATAEVDAARSAPPADAAMSAPTSPPMPAPMSAPTSPPTSPPMSVPMSVPMPAPLMVTPLIVPSTTPDESSAGPAAASDDARPRSAAAGPAAPGPAAPVSVPDLAAPAVAAPAAAPPAPTIEAPANAPQALATLAVAASAPALAAPALAAPAVAPPADGPAMFAPPSSDWSSPVEKRTSKSRRAPSAGMKQVGTAVLLGALGVGGLFASKHLFVEDQAPTVRPPAAPVVVDEPAQLPVSPDAATGNGSGIGIIDDANDVVDEINDNAQEDEALELLDLDPVGAFVAAPGASIFDGDEIANGAASVSDASSYSFTWSYPAGTSITAWIDATTGDFQMTTAANHVLRSVDGLLYEQAAPGGKWSLSPLQEFADRAFVGRDRLITTPSMLPVEMLEFATISEIGDDGFGSYLIDDVAFHRDNPQLRSDWLTIWGFDASIVPTESVDHGGVMPDMAGPGQILVHTEGGLDSVVTTATVSTPAGTSTYVLLEASRDERAIAVPDLG